MTFIQHLRTRFAIWRLQLRLEAADESRCYHERTGHLCLAIAERDNRLVKTCREELERLSTALAHGIAL